MYRATSLGSSPSLVPVLHPQPTLVCDPKTLNSPVTMEQAAIQAGPSSQVKGTRRTKTSSSRVPAADSDYSPSGESEVEDENDRSYGEPPNRKKTRSARVSHAAHPYLKPASKPKSNKGRGAKLEVPVPVPGLTKNSRGRCVPKKTEGDFEDRSRPFWCRVKDCNKLFGRGEHLKRHIKSIHTEEKREISNGLLGTHLLTATSCIQRSSASVRTHLLVRTICSSTCERKGVLTTTTMGYFNAEKRRVRKKQRPGRKRRTFTSSGSWRMRRSLRIRGTGPASRCGCASRLTPLLQHTRLSVSVPPRLDPHVSILDSHHIQRLPSLYSLDSGRTICILASPSASCIVFLLFLLLFDSAPLLSILSLSIQGNT